MDNSGIASVASTTAALKTGDAVGMLVLKKALDLQQANALALIQALPPVRASNLPSHLGRNIDTTA